jgi:hypothetical protein
MCLYLEMNTLVILIIVAVLAIAGPAMMLYEVKLADASSKGGFNDRIIDSCKVFFKGHQISLIDYADC